VIAVLGIEEEGKRGSRTEERGGENAAGRISLLTHLPARLWGGVMASSARRLINRHAIRDAGQPSPVEPLRFSERGKVNP